MIPFVELKSQFLGIEQEIRAAMDRVLEASWYVLGNELKAFEREFAGYLGTEHAVGVGSGTDAIHLALRAVGVGPGDEVITAANTCVPTLSGISASGAVPKLVDVSEDSLTMDPAALREAVSPETKAVVPVHLYGHPCDMDALLEVTKPLGISVVEDCAQAHGAKYKGQLCGTFGAAAAFSFYPSKNLGAYGDGGAVVTNDGDVADSLRKLRNYGEEKRYVHTTQGFNSRLDELQAAVLRVKLGYLDAWNAARRDLSGAYSEALATLPVSPVGEASWAESCFHLYVIRASGRDALQEHLKQREIGTFIHYPVPIHLQPAYAHLAGGRGAFPVAEQACDEVLSLPLYPELAREAVAEVAGAIKGFYGGGSELSEQGRSVEKNSVGG